MYLHVRVLLFLLTVLQGCTFLQQDPVSLDNQRPGRGDYPVAENYLREALRINPFDPIALNNLAVARAEQGDYEAALDLLSRAHRLAPHNPKITINLRRMEAWAGAYQSYEQPLFGGRRFFNETQEFPPARRDY